jgi:hypothetical protein
LILTIKYIILRQDDPALKEIEMGIDEFVYSVIASLIANILTNFMHGRTLSFLKKQSIKNRVSNALITIVEPLIPFLEREKISEKKQHLLIETCRRELTPFVEDPGLLFKGSLDGNKIFSQKYPKGRFPAEIHDEGLESVYSLLFPRLAAILCKIPEVLEDWEQNAWAENYRRLDELAVELKSLFQKIDAMAAGTQKQEDKLFTLIRQSLAQEFALTMDITGLRADKPAAGAFESYYVHPRLSREEKERKIVSDTGDDCFAVFSRKRYAGVVTGAPGAGKTTWSAWLKRKAFEQDDDILPIRVELRKKIDTALPSIQELVRESAGTHFKEDLTPELLRKWFSKHKMLFIFDGFDEIPPSLRDEFITWIEEIHTSSEQCPVVITSRPLTTEHLDTLKDTWQTWNIEPFDRERIVRYITQWYGSTALLINGDRNVDASAIARQWMNDPTIEPLTGNPLLLSTLLMVHHLDGRLPEGRAGLYNRYIRGMLGLWDSRRKVKAAGIELTQEQRYQILRSIALHMHLAKKDAFDDAEMERITASILKELNIAAPFEKVLDCLRERTGLIMGPGTWGFVHNTIKEYLMAETVYEGDRRDEKGRRIDRLYLLDCHDNDRWNTITFLWAGLTPKVDLEDFIRRCLAMDDWELGYGLLYDQYDRVEKVMRRTWMLELFKRYKGLKKGKYGVRFYPIAGPTHYLERKTFKSTIKALKVDHHVVPTDYLKIKAFENILPQVKHWELRGITTIELFEIFMRAYQKGDIVFDDLRGLDPQSYHFFLFDIGMSENNIEAIADIFRRLKEDQYHFILIFSFIVNKVSVIISEQEEALLDSFVAFINASYPEYTELWKLLYLAALVDIPFRPIERIKGFEKLLELFLSIQNNTIPDTFLKATKEWLYELDILGDLLIQCLKMLKYYAKKTRISPEILQKAIEDVEALIEQRNALEQQ